MSEIDPLSAAVIIAVICAFILGGIWVTYAIFYTRNHVQITQAKVEEATRFIVTEMEVTRLFDGWPVILGAEGTVTVGIDKGPPRQLTIATDGVHSVVGLPPVKEIFRFSAETVSWNRKPAFNASTLLSSMRKMTKSSRPLWTTR